MPQAGLGSKGFDSHGRETGMSNEGFIDKVKDFIRGHPEQADQGLDKGEEILNERTGGKYSEQVGKGDDIARQQLGVPEDSTTPQPDPAPSPQPGPAPSPQPGPAQPAPGEPTPTPGTTPEPPTVPNPTEPGTNEPQASEQP